MSPTSLEFQLLFEESPDVLLVLLPDTPRYTMVAATKARLAATMMTREQTLGRGLFEVFPDNPDDLAATGTSNLRASLDRVLTSKAADTMAVQKYDIRGPDGTFQAKYWSPKNIPVLSASGDVLYIFHRVEDVTDLVHASEVGQELRDKTSEMEREVIKRSLELSAANKGLRDANAKLGQLDAAKTAFFSNISHEFRTPLTLMLGPLEDLLADAADPVSASHRGRLELIHANSLRLLKLVNALLDFASLEAGRLNAHFAPLDVGAFTSELAGMFQSATHKTDVQLRIECPPLSEPVWVDREMWEKIVPNLVSNAFKFTQHGEIAVRVRDDGKHAVLEVSDTGTGIPAVELPKVFERFHRVAGAVGRTHEGTGIGLSLVRELVELHGGDISVESQFGRGTTFRVRIPKGFEHLPPSAVSQQPVGPGHGPSWGAHAAEAARWVGGHAAERVGHPPSAAPAPGAARARVMVVDDNADLREYMSTLLSPLYEVVVAADGLDALAKVRENAPDLVVSDVMMPNLDGFGLLAKLRSDPATASLPMILLSARAGEEASIEGLDAGSDDYLVKPFSARELLARVRTHLGLARTRREWVAELEFSNRELDAFSYSVSHDLRAPLRAVDGFSAALLEDYAAVLDDQGKKYLRQVRDSAQRMNALIDGLLDLSRVARGELKRESTDVSSLARAIGKRLADADPNRRVDFRVEEGLLANGDPRLVNVILENLLSNAWKFTRQQPNARVDVGRTEKGGALAFYVRDNGAGFDMDYAGKLFSPFQRLHAAKDFEGHGIGLATVQRVVRRHGGHLWVEARPNEGAAFYFTLDASSAATHSRSAG